jgi:hypothetical protein
VERARLFPSALHISAARDYQAEAAAINAQIELTRDAKLRSRLASRRDQKLRNADFHALLGQGG